MSTRHGRTDRTLPVVDDDEPVEGGEVAGAFISTLFGCVLVGAMIGVVWAFVRWLS